jgi:hypothetical protein
VDIPNSVTNIGGWAFGDCTSLSTINYEGTVEEWHNIQKDSDWSLLGYSCTVYCTDGNVTYGSDESEKMFDYVLETDSTCKITRYNGYDSYIVIPEYIDGYRVTAIGEKAFASNNNIISVTIPSTVTEIHSYAFLDCNGLENVIIPDSVTKIDTGAFQNCGSLITIDVPASVTSIGDDAFGAPCLLAINVEAGNNYYTSIDGVLLSADGKTLICYPCGKTPFVIPNGVEAIGLNAFKGCNNGVHTIVIPEGVTTIDSRAFNNLNLTDVTLPASVTSIGDYTFAGNTNLSKITYSGTVAEWAAVMKGAGWHSNTGNYTVYCTDGTIAKDGTITYNSTEDPEVEALYEYITSDDGTCEINQYYGNEAHVVIPEYLGGYKVVSIAKGAFYANTSIMSVTIPNGVTSIGEQAFADCTSMTEVIIPESVETIYSDAFDGCDNLKSVYYNSTISEWQTVYLGNYGESTWNATVYCTDGSIAADGTVTYN